MFLKIQMSGTLHLRTKPEPLGTGHRCIHFLKVPQMIFLIRNHHITVPLNCIESKLSYTPKEQQTLKILAQYSKDLGLLTSYTRHTTSQMISASVRNSDSEISCNL